MSHVVFRARGLRMAVGGNADSHREASTVSGRGRAAQDEACRGHTVVRHGTVAAALPGEGLETSFDIRTEYMVVVEFRTEVKPHWLVDPSSSCRVRT